MKRTLTILLLVFCVSAVKAQTVYDDYLEFSAAFTQNKTVVALRIGNKILASKEKLPAKAETNFYAKMGNLYEYTDNDEQATIYYSKVLLSEPDYFTAHRALGYLYLKQVNVLGKKVNASMGNKAEYDKNRIAYKKCIDQCLRYLEKSQACDPDDQTLNIIKSLYHSLKDDAKFNTLEDRMKPLRVNCVSLLTD